MDRRKDKSKIKNRKKLWDIFNFGYPEDGWFGFFRKNHSLNCGCSYCRAKTYFRKYENRQDRHKIKEELHNINPDN